MKLSPAAPTKVTLFFSAEVRGYLGPCGCSENMRGGLSRAAWVLAQAQREGPIHYIDAGDGLFGAAQIPEEAVPQEELKARVMARAWKSMGLTLRARGALDDVRGAAFREALGLPELGQGSFRLVDQVGVLNAPTGPAALALALRARAAGARFVVALVPQPFDELLRDSAQAGEIDLFLSTRSRDAFAAEENRLAGETVKVAQVQSKGRSLLRVDVFFDLGGRVQWLRGSADQERELSLLDERIELLRAQINEPMLGEELKSLRRIKLEELISRRQALGSAPLPAPDAKDAAVARFVPLESTLPKEPAVQQLEKAHDVEVGLLNLAWAKAHGKPCPPASSGQSDLTGTATCAGCHPLAEQVWKQTKHPRAYASLVEVGKQHHLDCIGCHVTGWKQPQGVCRIDQTAGREEVGCEACHGGGAMHAKEPRKDNINRGGEAKSCQVCHDKENSPYFDFERYLEKVLGPGHGRPG